MLGEPWLDHYLRGAGGLMTELHGDRKRKRGSLENRPSHRFIIGRRLPAILQVAIALLLITRGYYRETVSADTFVAGALGNPLHFGIIIVIAAFYESLHQTPTSIG